MHSFLVNKKNKIKTVDIKEAYEKYGYCIHNQRLYLIEGRVKDVIHIVAWSLKELCGSSINFLEKDLKKVIPISGNNIDRIILNHFGIEQR